MIAIQQILYLYFKQPVARLCIALSIVFPFCSDVSADVVARFQALSHAGYLVTDHNGLTLADKKSDQSFIPASTTKLVTAWLALNHWGEDYRFSTEFTIDRKTSTLWVKAGGDPFLVSEELEIIAGAIARLDPGEISKIALDVSLFQPDLVVPGATVTNNPYDAVPSAIAANFNTVYLEKQSGIVLSAEPQTPLTPFALTFANQIVGDSLRINTGRKSRQAEKYFAQLLKIFLEQKGLSVGADLTWGIAPRGAPDYIHYNSRTLGEIIRAMLKYSTNFIANQILLTLVAQETGKAANFENVRAYLHNELAAQFLWKNFILLEGAGLSADNRLSPIQLVDLLKAFALWRHLLPEVDAGIFAKTGTLTGVSTLAGYLGITAQPRMFVLMINEAVDRRFIREVAVKLAAK